MLHLNLGHTQLHQMLHIAAPELYERASANGPAWVTLRVGDHAIGTRKAKLVFDERPHYLAATVDRELRFPVRFYVSGVGRIDLSLNKIGPPTYTFPLKDGIYTLKEGYTVTIHSDITVSVTG